ncbi:MAG TPA: epoxyqueuosine reductase QueH [Acetomicrobium flavidum]|uniref:Epoxyqueuosine reductase QueH n=2 Tax=Acetomicrobium flavidum TaxID=49896 RepID=A0ABY1JCA4_9BACT|nr:hypothetical protein SAMN05444368_0700 [Acetomicrobium flavidum]HOM30524.1 epoxyqueuosine reductase QueH [Acetomicrobium flavidum]HOP87342.1 epoxyqueuosine reductase QueH [Acetomicrobium flavidum]HPP13616.1 epoxyqueuosine reductase QueH [Acetomicrobium flavidum]
MRVLLHICCAPDGTVPLESLKLEGNVVTCFFYGINIHPKEEYDKRLEAAKKLAANFGVSLLTLPYGPGQWLNATKALADEPEGGSRCVLCYRLQMEAAVRYAVALNYDACATSLTISPHKDPDLINAIGLGLANRACLAWIGRVWRKGGGFARSVAKSKELGLYRQRYCGCVYSIRR